MAEIEKKIQQLKMKKSAKITKRDKTLARISEEKSEVKKLNREITEIDEEIRQLELKQLSETLSRNGITAADITAAIAAGGIKKSEKSDEEQEESADMYSTNSDKEEQKNEEIDSSRETLRGA